jgi:Protein of unknown function (DUF3617)
MTRVFSIKAAMVLCLRLASTACAHDLQPGLYEITLRVELPNVLAAAEERKLRRCISLAEIEEHDAFQIHSENPLAKCPRSPMCLGDGQAGFQVFCPGRTVRYAEAMFNNSAQHFSGRILMNMGGKNMTVIERQEGRRIGACSK